MSVAKRMYEAQMEAEDKRCSECGKDDAFDFEAIGDQPQAACDCGVFEWWCDVCRHGYNGDCCGECLARALAHED